MGAFSGPEIVNDGLVFAYDMANTQKSWKGAPTINLVTNNDISTYNRTGLVSTPTPGEIDPEGNNTAYKIIANTSAVDFDFIGIPAAQPSGVITVSSYLKGAGYNTGSLFLTQGGNNGAIYNFLTGVASPQGVGNTAGMEYVKNDWWRCWVSNPGNTASGYRIGPGSGALSAIAGNGVDGILVWRPQVEQNSFATPFVNGTRSNTQSILDLTGNNNVTATSLTYASDGTFSFNGSSNSLNCGNNNILDVGNNITVNSWFYVGSNTYYLPIVAKHPSNGSSGWEIANSSGVFRSTLRSSASQINLAAGSLVIGNWYMGTMTYDNTALKLYLNGVLTGSTSDGGPVTLNSTQPLLIGTREIASYGNYFNGNIPSSQIYNRALTAAEIQQNFNATRGRYSI